MAATAQKQTDQQAPPAPNRGAIAVIAPPRLPYHESVHERFGVDKSAWKALCESVFPTAKTSGAIILALSYCKARKLDPFKKPVHIVPIYDSQKREYVESVWPGIGEHRTTAFRTDTYAGMDPCVFGETVTDTFKDKVKDGQGWKTVEVDVTFPAWAQVTIYRMVQGQRVAFPGPRVMWREFYSRMGRSIIPNERWQKAPIQMIEKCAEAGALRRGFPEELGEDWTAEEAGFFGASDAKDITPEKSSVPAEEPTRAQFRQTTDAADENDAGASEVVDQDTGEVTTTEGAAAADVSDAAQQGDAASTQSAQADEQDWTIPYAPTEKQIDTLTDMLAEASTVERVEAIRAANADLFKKWSGGKPGSAHAKALEAANAAFDEATKRLAA